MKKHLWGLLPLAALALTLAACTAAAEVPEEPTTDPGPAVAVTVPPQATLPPDNTSDPEELLAVRPAMPLGRYEPWQEGYMDFLTALRQTELEAQERFRSLTDEELEADQDTLTLPSRLSTEYSLYDVDENGIPELFIRFGSCEADYHTECYTFRDGETVLLGEFHSGHSSLWSAPGQNGFVIHYGHMGCAAIELCTLSDGALVFSRRLLEEDLNTIHDAHPDDPFPDYTYPGDLIPGSEALVTCRTHLSAPENVPMLLPIYDHSQPPAAPALPGSSGLARAAIEAVLRGEGTLYGVSGDGYQGDTGSVSFTDYLQSASPYGPLEPQDFTWCDLNGDGAEEYLLRLRDAQGSSCMAALSLQDGTVYAYYLFYMPYDLNPDGVFFSPQGSYAFTLSFYREQCYSRLTPFPRDVTPLAWEPF